MNQTQRDYINQRLNDFVTDDLEIDRYSQFLDRKLLNLRQESHKELIRIEKQIPEPVLKFIRHIEREKRGERFSSHEIEANLKKRFPEVNIEEIIEMNNYRREIILQIYESREANIFNYERRYFSKERNFNELKDRFYENSIFRKLFIEYIEEPR